MFLNMSKSNFKLTNFYINPLPQIYFSIYIYIYIYIYIINYHDFRELGKYYVKICMAH